MNNGKHIFVGCVQRTIAFAMMSALWLSVLSAAELDDERPLPAKFETLIPLHEKLGEPRRGDWLDKHDEPGQTYGEYLAVNPVRVYQYRRVLYVQPLGEFTKTQRKIVDLSVEYLRIYYQLPVRVREPITLDDVPDSARRKATLFRSEQFLTTHILNEMLKPQLRRDAVAVIGAAAVDLWPGYGNYVFGQASYGDRVGVWSIKRFGDADRDEQSYRLCLRRTLKTVTHETGHMFTMLHCTAYNCNMCGSNHLGEADRRPLALCPHCLAKLCYATRADPVKRFRELMKFHEANGLKAEWDFCEKSLEAMQKK